jgi:uncharacterized membrane protein
MSVWKYLLLWIASFIFTSAIDAAWHLGIFGKIYSAGIKPLARMKGDKMAFSAPWGLLSQVLVVTSLVFLVLYKSQKGTMAEAALVGAVAGVLAITVYGVTNYALFKDWNLSMTILEVVWGPILGGLSGAFAFWMKTLLLK